MADRKTAGSLGQLAYEADRLERPYYTNGRSRPSWDGLSDISREAWERSPSPLPCPPIDIDVGSG